MSIRVSTGVAGRVAWFAGTATGSNAAAQAAFRTVAVAADVAVVAFSGYAAATVGAMANCR